MRWYTIEGEAPLVKQMGKEKRKNCSSLISPSYSRDMQQTVQTSLATSILRSIKLFKVLNIYEKGNRLDQMKYISYQGP